MPADGARGPGAARNPSTGSLAADAGGERGRGPLAGVRVIDAATLYAGPYAAMQLGDFGADVLKVEHPKGDPWRRHGPSKDGTGLWWKVLARNKRCVTLNLSTTEGQAIFARLCETADVVIENFRPGVMEGWGLGYERLSATNPGLIMLRCTGFGQFGPRARRPAFGTLAEAMSGFAAMTGWPDKPPTLPPFGLADGIAGLSGALAVLLGLFHRAIDPAHLGQVIDLAIVEPIISVLGAQITIYDQLGLLQSRMGNRSGNNAPRNVYETSDSQWVAVSTSSQNVAERVLRMTGHGEVVDEPWFASGEGRARHADLLDGYVSDWVRSKTRAEVLDEFAAAGGAASPVYDASQIPLDPQFEALRTVISLDDEDLGAVKMQNVIFRMLRTPGQVRFPGRRLGQDNGEVYAALGLAPDDLQALHEKGVV